MTKVVSDRRMTLQTKSSEEFKNKDDNSNKTM